MTATFTTALVRRTASAVLLLPLAGVASAQHPGSHSGGMGGAAGGLGGFGWWPLFWSLLLLSLVLVAGYGLYTRNRPPARDQADQDTALSTLRSRYARGELDEAAFEERRQRLEE